ncbi:WD40-repeat-containing domain protein [Pelagophyceae sp. CCMP2097]|nr:WD40-repeat-containing domain protein [Pelagophyceae sp. CCMP2097]
MSLRPERRIENAHEDGIWSLCWTSRGQLVTGSVDETVKVWKAAGTEKKPDVVKAGNSLGVASVVVDSSGHSVFSASLDSVIRISDVDTGELTGVIDAGPVECWTLALSPDDAHIASGTSRGTVNVWNVESRTKEASLGGGTGAPAAARGPFERRISGFTLAVAYSPDGASIAASSADGSIVLYDVATSSVRAKFDAGISKQAVRSISFTPDGAVLLAASDDCKVHAYDVDRATTKPFWALSGHASWVLGVACSPDNRHFASCGADRSVRLWDFQAKACVAQIDAHHHDHVWAVAYSPDGSRLASCSDDCAVQFYATDANP